MSHLLVLGCILTGGVLTILKLQCGLAVYVLLVPFLSLGGVLVGEIVSASMIYSLVLLSALGFRLLAGGVAPRFSRLAPWLLGFGFVSLAGLLHPGTSWQLAILPVFYGALHVLLYSLLSEESTARRLIAIVSVSVAVLSALAVAGHVLGWPSWGAPSTVSSLARPMRLEGPAQNPNALASVLLFGVPLLLAMVLTARRRFRKLLWGAGLLVTLVALVLTSSRSAYLGGAVAVGGFALGLGTRQRRALVVVVVVVAVAVGFYVAAFSGGQFVNRLMVFKNDGRLHQLTLVGQIVADEPLFGVGPGRFREAVAERDPDALVDPHNNLTLVLVEDGLVGFTLFVAALAGAILIPFRAARRSQGDRRVVLAAASAAIAGYLVHGLFHVNYRWTLLWLAITIALALADAEPKAREVA